MTYEEFFPFSIISWKLNVIKSWTLDFDTGLLFPFSIFSRGSIKHIMDTAPSTNFSFKNHITKCTAHN